MNCEEFEALGLDARRDGTLSEAERAALREHTSFCPRCAALQDSWLAASEELRVYGESTQAVMAPARVEMRLRQEFRTRHQTQRNRRTALIAGWAMATAAVLVGAVSWINWRATRHDAIAKQEPPSPGVPEQIAGARPSAAETSSAKLPRIVHADTKDWPHRHINDATNMAADSDTGAFTPLPGSFATELDDAAVVRVRMQRGALGALGLPVNEERAGEWVQVDLLVSNDGLPQAVRLRR
jgi:hypothetical protein